MEGGRRTVLEVECGVGGREYLCAKEKTCGTIENALMVSKEDGTFIMDTDQESGRAKSHYDQFHNTYLLTYLSIHTPIKNAPAQRSRSSGAGSRQGLILTT